MQTQATKTTKKATKATKATTPKRDPRAELKQACAELRELEKQGREITRQNVNATRQIKRELACTWLHIGPDVSDLARVLKAIGDRCEERGAELTRLDSACAGLELRIMDLKREIARGDAGANAERLSRV